MADMFMVYDLVSRSKSILSFKEICDIYKESDLLLLNESSIFVVSIYKGGQKIAVINRIKGGATDA